MKKTTFQYMALSAMFIGTFGLASCDKNDESNSKSCRNETAFRLFQHS